MNWLQTQNQQSPKTLFIQEGTRAYSFIDVSEMVQIYSQSLLREGIQPQDRILICLPGGTQMSEIILACFEIGAIATPISPMLREKERRTVIENIKPENHEKLLIDLQDRVGMSIQRFEIDRINFLRDTVRIDIYCKD